MQLLKDPEILLGTLKGTRGLEALLLRLLPGNLFFFLGRERVLWRGLLCCSMRWVLVSGLHDRVEEDLYGGRKEGDRC
jgi:hypothetical protein